MRGALMDYEQFKTQILQLTTIDLNAYKERQMKRRIDSLIERNKYDGYRRTDCKTQISGL